MLLRKNIKSFSFAFFAFLLILNAVNYAFNLKLDSILALEPHRVLTNFEVWRLVSYTFIMTDPAFVFILAPALMLISPILEDYLNKYLYPIFLFLVSCLQSFVLTLVFWNKQILIGGIEGISFFIITLLVLLKPRARIFPKYPITVASFSIVIATLWALSAYLPLGELDSFSVSNLASAAFGIVFGICVFVPIKYMDRYVKKRQVEPNEKKVAVPKPEELSIAAISAQNLTNLYHQFDESYCAISDDIQENEDTLNEILDKINASGKESLSYHELKFLKDYSKRL